MSAPHWLPDWSDDSAYPVNYDDWPLYRWGWEFLRRNAEYQSDYAHFAAIPDCWPDTGTKTPKWSCKSMMGDWSMEFRYCDPPALPGETYREYWKRNDGCVIEEMPFEAYLMGKWSISHVPDPANNDGFKYVTFDLEMPPYILRIDPPSAVPGYVSPMPDPDEEGQVTLRFDVRFNIERQIEEAGLILHDELERMRDGALGAIAGGFKRVRANLPNKIKLPIYLRAFDADLSGVGPRELAGKICPTKRNSPDSLRSADEEARRAIRAGKSLVDMGYKNLLKFG